MGGTGEGGVPGCESGEAQSLESDHVGLWVDGGEWTVESCGMGAAMV